MLTLCCGKAFKGVCFQTNENGVSLLEVNSRAVPQGLPFEMLELSEGKLSR